MRVIAGKAKRLPLKTLPGQETRPTTDRIKETLFNMIQDELYGIRFLDLFAGSGGIGIEALSRGAAYAVFVEQNRKAAQCIRENLVFTRLEQDACLMTMDVMSALRRLEKEGPFQVIFMDPPYGKGLERDVLMYLEHSSLVTEETLIIVEEALETSFSYLEASSYEVKKRKEYKTNVHMFLQRTRGAAR